MTIQISDKTYHFITSKSIQIDKLLKVARKKKDKVAEAYWSGKRMLLTLIIEKIEEDNKK